jgi:hypothetical protein
MKMGRSSWRLSMAKQFSPQTRISPAITPEVTQILELLEAFTLVFQKKMQVLEKFP